MRSHRYVLVIEDSMTDFLLLHHALKATGYEPVDANLLWEIPDGTVALIVDWSMTPKMECHRDELLVAAGAINLPRCVFTSYAVDRITAAVPDGVDVIPKNGLSHELTQWLRNVAPIDVEME